MFSLWRDQPHSYSQLKSKQPCNCYKFTLECLQQQPGSLKQEVCRLYSVSINNNQCPYINSVPKVSIPVTLTLAWDQFCSLRYPLCYVMGSNGGPGGWVAGTVPLHCTWVPSTNTGEPSTSVVSDDG